MNIWIFLWLIVAIIILGSSSWAYLLLFRQKAVWAEFARKHKLTFTNNGWLQAPQVRGVMHKNLTLTLYTEQQVAADGRNQRYRNVVLVEAPWGIKGGGAVAASPLLRNFINNLKLPGALPLEGKNWPNGTLFHTQNVALLEAHMTPERTKLVQTLLGMKNADPMVLFDDDTFFIRLETADPLIDAAKLEKLLGKLFTIADAMKPKGPAIPDAEVVEPTPAPAAAPIPETETKASAPPSSEEEINNG